MMNDDNSLKYLSLINRVKDKASDNRSMLAQINHVDRIINECSDAATSSRATETNVSLAEDLTTILSIAEDAMSLRKSDRDLFLRLIKEAKRLS